MKKLIYIFILCLVCPICAFSANVYVCDTAVCGNTPTAPYDTWAKAYDDLPAALNRDNTYYIADGDYATYIFDDAVDGTKVITIKKATASDHGTDSGWNASYGDGQAVFAGSIQFTKSYYVFDGNGTHTVPSSTSSDYGFKINATGTSWVGVIKIGDGSDNPSNITIKYTHAYNTNPTIASDECKNNDDTTSVRFYIGAGKQYFKFQNCFFQNSGQDGILLLGPPNYVLFERCYFKQLGEHGDHVADYHGQTIRQDMGGTDIIFRYNIFESCEGEALWSIFGSSGSPARLRFYGNIVMNPYGHFLASSGFNAGLMHYWNEGGTAPDGIYVYNNTIVNIAGTYDQCVLESENSANVRAWFLLDADATNAYIHNNLFYDSHNNTSTNWDGHSYHASGGGDTAGGTNEQTGLASTIFTNYTGNVFRLASNTTAGLDISAQGWWSGGADAFFGTIDSALDMYGNTRTTWSRGAFEYQAGSSSGNFGLGSGPPFTFTGPALRVQ